jgi:hypothetical protein
MRPAEHTPPANTSTAHKNDKAKRRDEKEKEKEKK